MSKYTRRGQMERQAAKEASVPQDAVHRRYLPPSVIQAAMDGRQVTEPPMGARAVRLGTPPKDLGLWVRPVSKSTTWVIEFGGHKLSIPVKAGESSRVVGRRIVQLAASLGIPALMEEPVDVQHAAPLPAVSPAPAPRRSRWRHVGWVAVVAGLLGLLVALGWLLSQVQR